MEKRMSDHREKYRCNVRHTNAELFEIGELVLTFDQRQKCFSQEGKIVSHNPPPWDGFGPCSYTVEFEEGGSWKINAQWLTKMPFQEDG